MKCFSEGRKKRNDREGEKVLFELGISLGSPLLDFKESAEQKKGAGGFAAAGGCFSLHCLCIC